MIVIGLTGGIGAGKSTFASFLAELGAHVVDVDAVGRAVIVPGGPGAAAVVERFGTLDRRAIAQAVFADENARRDLEAISWPLIEAELAAELEQQRGRSAVVVLDMAVLPQGLARGLYGPVVTVEAPEHLRLRRLVGRGMTEQDARSRMRSQVTEETRRRLADVVVVNDTSPDALRAEAEQALIRLAGPQRPTADPP